jgi:multidrug efflux pump subunit AcrA (membrane-fusion protein)
MMRSNLAPREKLIDRLIESDGLQKAIAEAEAADRARVEALRSKQTRELDEVRAELAAVREASAPKIDALEVAEAEALEALRRAEEALAQEQAGVAVAEIQLRQREAALERRLRGNCDPQWPEFAAELHERIHQLREDGYRVREKFTGYSMLPEGPARAAGRSMHQKLTNAGEVAEAQAAVLKTLGELDEAKLEPMTSDEVAERIEELRAGIPEPAAP